SSAVIAAFSSPARSVSPFAVATNTTKVHRTTGPSVTFLIEKKCFERYLSRCAGAAEAHQRSPDASGPRPSPPDCARRAARRRGHRYCDALLARARRHAIVLVVSLANAGPLRPRRRSGSPKRQGTTLAADAYRARVERRHGRA